MAANRAQTVSIVLKLHHPEALEAFIAQTVDPQSPAYHQFLDTAGFAAAYGPSDAELHAVLDFIRNQGLKVEAVHDNHLLIRASGTVGQCNALFQTQVVQAVDEKGRAYQKPDRQPRIPAAVAGNVAAVLGLDTRVAFHSHTVTTQRAVPAGAKAPAVVLPPAGATATGVPGSYTVGDVANLYNLNPLYNRRITGRGRTLGIATLATFDPADAFAYWQAVGLTVDPKRITVIPVDGGAGPDGADETTLDVQQSGGVAYGAKIRVYEAPNTNAGFVDLFSQAISENKVDTLSVSWGEGEVFNDDPTLAAFHQVFMQAAAQGIPVFASSGDSGAFDVNRVLPTPFYSPLNSVDHPGSDPYVTSAGGTTLPFTAQLAHGVVSVAKERPWGWDYLEPYIVANNSQFYYDFNFFPVGGGGGVSVAFPMPSWQARIFGTQASPVPFSSIFFYPNYTATNPDKSGAQDLADLPTGYVGRNVPDVSLNADPFTGYLVLFGGALYAGYGGTSFVAPQLNGIAAVLTQANEGRLGFLNPQLYKAYRKYGYGPRSPFKAVTTGTNLYWHAGPNYNPASGLGTLDVVKLGNALHD